MSKIKIQSEEMALKLTRGLEEVIEFWYPSGFPNISVQGAVCDWGTVEESIKKEKASYIRFSFGSHCTDVTVDMTDRSVLLKISRDGTKMSVFVRPDSNDTFGNWIAKCVDRGHNQLKALSGDCLHGKNLPVETVPFPVVNDSDLPF